MKARLSLIPDLVLQNVHEVIQPITSTNATTAVFSLSSIRNIDEIQVQGNANYAFIFNGLTDLCL
jgi:hypothetical protein